MSKYYEGFAYQDKGWKCSLDAHFAIAMAHVMQFVNMGQKVATPSQIVCTLNLNRGLGNKKPMLYIVSRKVQRKIEENNANELHRLNKCFGRVNEIRFDDSRELPMTTFEYYGFDPFQVSYKSSAPSTNDPDEAIASLIPEEEKEGSNSNSDNGDAVICGMELVESGLDYDDEAVESTGDVLSNETEEEAGFVTGPCIVPARVIRKKMKRWKLRKKKGGPIMSDALMIIPSKYFCV